jgi:hypothetical protein
MDLSLADAEEVKGVLPQTCGVGQTGLVHCSATFQTCGTEPIKRGH